jgi:hypothetical protein
MMMILGDHGQQPHSFCKLPLFHVMSKLWNFEMLLSGFGSSFCTRQDLYNAFPAKHFRVVKEQNKTSLLCTT